MHQLALLIFRPLESHWNNTSSLGFLVYQPQTLGLFSLQNRDISFSLYIDIHHVIYIQWASLVAQMIKNWPTKQETQVQFLGQEDPLEKRMATHSKCLTGEFHGQRSLVSYSPWGCRVRQDWATKTNTHTHTHTHTNIGCFSGDP